MLIIVDLLKQFISIFLLSKNKKKLLKSFGHISRKGEFIETIMNENCQGYVKKETITQKQGAEIIKAAGGKSR